MAVASYPFLPGRGSHKYLEWAGPFYWIWSIRGVVAVPLVRIGGGCGELKGKKNLLLLFDGKEVCFPMSYCVLGTGESPHGCQPVT